MRDRVKETDTIQVESSGRKISGRFETKYVVRQVNRETEKISFIISLSVCLFIISNLINRACYKHWQIEIYWIQKAKLSCVEIRHTLHVSEGFIPDSIGLLN